MARNLKLWNHWIAEVRDIAKENKCVYTYSEDKNGNPKLMGNSAIKWYFDKTSMENYFNDGLTPQEAFTAMLTSVHEWGYTSGLDVRKIVKA